MTVLTYRGKKYTQNTEVSQLQQPVLLKYRGLEVMSKRIHEAISAEIAWVINQLLWIKKEPIKAPFLFKASKANNRISKKGFLIGMVWIY